MINDAFAQSSANAGGGMSMLIMVGLFFVIMYFMIIRPQNKRVKEHNKLIDSLTNKPIEYVSVSIISEESNEVISGNITDSFGKFRINDIDPGRYYLKLEFMGYKNNSLEMIKNIISTNIVNLLAITQY